MIELPRPPFDFTRQSIKVFGIGGAGCNALDRIVLDGLPGADLIAINTDVQALTGCVAQSKVQIGQTITRGLGAGGDPEIGRTAAEEGIGEILGALSDATIVFLVVGLGGGTGSGAAPIIAEVTREHNAMVIVIATMPFQFEGKRRTAQALESLAAIHRSADIVICFENDRMGEAVSPKASIQEAFAVADNTIGQCVRSLVAMAHRRGPVHAGLDEIATAVRGEVSRSLFGHGWGEGDNRLHEALDMALRNPLLDRGRRLRDAEAAVVQIAGGPDMTLDEVHILMEEVNRHLHERTKIFFGAAVDQALAGRLVVTIVSAVPAELPAGAVLPTREPAALAPVPEPVYEDEVENDPELELPVEEYPAAHAASVQEEEEVESEPEPEPEPEPEMEPELVHVKPQVRPAAATGNPRPLFAPLRRSAPAPAPAPEAAPAQTAREQKAEQMQFEPVNRGRFEKSEPTIVDGQDLDVPTFLRRNVRLK